MHLLGARIAAHRGADHHADLADGEIGGHAMTPSAPTDRKEGERIVAGEDGDVPAHRLLELVDPVDEPLP